MEEITLAELALKHAQLTEKAARHRAEARYTSAASSRGSHLSKAARLAQARADDYEALLELARNITLGNQKVIDKDSGQKTG